MALTLGQGLALIRIAFGLYFLSQAVDKLRLNWLGTGEPMANFVGGFVQRNQVEGFYRPFVEGVILPNAATFAQLVVLGELLIALSLILGLFTRLGALGAIWLTLNFMLLKGLLNNAGSPDRLFLVANLVFFLTSAGLVWGLDGYLRHVWATNPLTRWIAGLTGPRPERLPSPQG